MKKKLIEKREREKLFFFSTKKNKQTVKILIYETRFGMKGY